MLPKLTLHAMNQGDIIYVPSSLLSSSFISYYIKLYDHRCIYFDDTKTNVFINSHVLAHQGYSQYVLQTSRDHVLAKIQAFNQCIVESNLLILYVSRSDSNRRKLLNEKNLIEAINRKLNCKLTCIVPTSYTVEDQLDIFRSARIVIGLHGAGLANIVFCKKGTHIIEIAPSVHKNICYQYLSTALGLIHHFAYFSSPPNANLLYDNFTLEDLSISNIVQMIVNIADLSRA